MTGNVLLVEGKDDERVVYHLCAHHDIPKNFEVKSCGGIEQVLNDFPSYLKSHGDDDGDADSWTVGVLIDANTRLLPRWNSLRQHLKEAGYPSAPAEPPKGGFISGPPPEDRVLPSRVGIWLMPDNKGSGALEDFLYSLAQRKNSPLLEYARNSIDAIPPKHRLFKPKDDVKALLYTLLAWQEEPGKPFGAAIRAGFLDPGASEAAEFVDWLRRLFG